MGEGLIGRTWVGGWEVEGGVVGREENVEEIGRAR